ncbi:hypothetical protein PIB30_017866 [Stylosanthes scabra]|uniref:Uncharacterized protein n=1 Tax=Stylosanthes scabra TaxID=79078 RepID=A0ABU6X801_9FABA|nr:hypothetical protein [Stylosanthes scabra]
MINLQLVDKKGRDMAKNSSMRHSIAIMLFAMRVIVCSAIADESSNIIFEGHWVSSSSHHDIASASLKECIQECQLRHPLIHNNAKTCTMHCCLDECRRLEPSDRKKFMNCVENLYANYVKDNRPHNSSIRKKRISSRIDQSLSTFSSRMNHGPPN